ncbi:transient receptor potential cation channel subfamily V member 6-like isoform X1 [Leucoraja erinacea]|uniref:transient receptor potential cation channel subfamily V member 6-like isoform X1 n=1 Tax=Leucoraja erinaceus TaxID=7782 RepID=UPI0024566E8C|nr:transient receptor potential cation channel subfamily V member 6-like isoform X1 [Leucoraja erinacea]
MPVLLWEGWRPAVGSWLRSLWPEPGLELGPGPRVYEMHVVQQRRISKSPLLSAAKENKDKDIYKLAQCTSVDLFETGTMGETALHIAAMHDNNNAVMALLQVAPELINISITGKVYEGLTALHIAVANENASLVKELISRGADVATSRATGTFFRHSRGSIAYYGEHLLSFAACVGNKEIVRIFIENGADIAAQDCLGNTVLHVLVLQPNSVLVPQMYDLILSYDDPENEIPVDMIINKNGLSPIKLSASEGNIQMFQHLLMRKELDAPRTYGPLCTMYYNLSEIDSWGDDNSVLQLVISSENKEALKIFRLSPMKELILLKWNNYAIYYFRILAFLYLIYITIFTFCCTYRPLKPRPDNATSEKDSTIYIERTLQESYVTSEDHLRLLGEIISIFGAVAILFVEVHDILRYGPKKYFGRTALGGPFHVINICYGVMVLTVLVLRLASLPGETVPMSLALILAWCNLMYFARGFRLMGPFTIMIQKIIFEIILPFLVLMLIVLLAFTFSTHLSFQVLDPEKWERFVDFSTVLFTMYLLFFGLVNMPLNWEVNQPDMARLLYAIYTLLAFAIMVFLVIHIMGELIRRIAKEREDIWRAQVVATVLLLERRLPSCLFPPLGICGKKYGLGDNWYIRVDFRIDNTVLEIPPKDKSVETKGQEKRMEKEETSVKSESKQRTHQTCHMVRKRRIRQNPGDLYNMSYDEA